jgi:hypothetical protein
MTGCWNVNFLLEGGISLNAFGKVYYAGRGKREYKAWGDYASILIHGMGKKIKDTGDPPDIEVERVGPFVPSISSVLAGLIATDEAKQIIESWNLVGLRFKPVIKKRIVRLNWREWDPKKEPKYPAGGEPENYILGRKHDEELSDQIGVLWGVTSIDSATFKEVAAGEVDFERSCLISERFKSLLEESKLDEWLDIEVAEPKEWDLF